MKNTQIIFGLIVAIGLIGFIIFNRANQTPTTPAESPKPQEEVYDPKIDPQNFVLGGTNQYYSLTPGTTYTYQGKTKEGSEKIVTEITDKTKVVMGVTTTVIWDRVWIDNSLVEETYDWYAQDKAGNIWYFGEDSKEYEDGKVVSTKGSWEAGVNGAKPGIVMKADPKVGDSYRQEYYKGEAEDMADVISLQESVTVSLGTYSNCLKTRDWSKIDPNLNEYKYYCPEIGFLTLETSVPAGQESVELVSVTKK